MKPPLLDRLMSVLFQSLYLLAEMQRALLVLACLALYSCEWDTRLLLLNKTSKTVCYRAEEKTRDDSIPDLAGCETAHPYRVSPDSERIVPYLGSWDVYFEHHPDHILRIFIMSEDSISKYGACKVFRQQIFLKRIDLTYENLKSMNWKVVYDGR